MPDTRTPHLVATLLALTKEAAKRLSQPNVDFARTVVARQIAKQAAALGYIHAQDEDRLAEWLASSPEAPLAFANYLVDGRGAETAPVSYKEAEARPKLRDFSYKPVAETEAGIRLRERLLGY